MKFFRRIIYIFVIITLCNGTCENYAQDEVTKDSLYRSYCSDIIQNKNKYDKIFDRALAFTNKRLFVSEHKYQNGGKYNHIDKYDPDGKHNESEIYDIIKLKGVEIERLDIEIIVTEIEEGASVLFKGYMTFKSTDNNSEIISDIPDDYSCIFFENKGEKSLGNVLRNLIKNQSNSFNGDSIYFENEECIKKYEFSPEEKNRREFSSFFFHNNVILEAIPNSLLQGEVNITLTMPSKFHITNSTVNFQKQIKQNENDNIDIYIWNKPKSQKYPGHMFLEFNFDRDYKLDITQEFKLDGKESITGPMPFLNIDNIVYRVQFLNSNGIDISGKINSNMYSENNTYGGEVYDNHVKIELPKGEKILRIQYDILSHIGILKRNINNTVIDFSKDIELKRLSEEIINQCNSSDMCDCVKASWLCRWVHDYMQYFQHTSCQSMSPIQLVYEKAGVCADYVMLFLGLCSAANIKNLYDICGFAKNSSDMDKNAELHEWACMYCPQCEKMAAFDPTWGLCYGLPPSHIAIRIKSRINEPTYNIKPDYKIFYENKLYNNTLSN